MVRGPKLGPKWRCIEHHSLHQANMHTGNSNKNTVFKTMSRYTWLLMQCTYKPRLCMGKGPA